MCTSSELDRREEMLIRPARVAVAEKKGVSSFRPNQSSGVFLGHATAVEGSFCGLYFASGMRSYYSVIPLTFRTWARKKKSRRCLPSFVIRKAASSSPLLEIQGKDEEGAECVRQFRQTSQLLTFLSSCTQSITKISRPQRNHQLGGKGRRFFHLNRGFVRLSFFRDGVNHFSLPSLQRHQTPVGGGCCCT